MSSALPGLVLASVVAAALVGCASSSPGSAPPPGAPEAAAPQSPYVAWREELDVPVRELTPELVHRCTGYSLPLSAHTPRQDSVAFELDAEAAATFGPPDKVHLDLLGVYIFRGRSSFGGNVPSLAEKAPPGSKEREPFTAFENPAPETTPDKRVVTTHRRDFFLAGRLAWATLESPRGAHDTVLYVEYPPRDEGIEKEEQAAIGKVDLTSALACLDAALFPKAGRPLVGHDAAGLHNATVTQGGSADTACRGVQFDIDDLPLGCNKRHDEAGDPGAAVQITDLVPELTTSTARVSSGGTIVAAASFANRTANAVNVDVSFCDVTFEGLTDADGARVDLRTNGCGVGCGGRRKHLTLDPGGVITKPIRLRAIGTFEEPADACRLHDGAPIAPGKYVLHVRASARPGPNAMPMGSARQWTGVVPVEIVRSRD